MVAARVGAVVEEAVTAMAARSRSDSWRARPAIDRLRSRPPLRRTWLLVPALSARHETSEAPADRCCATRAGILRGILLQE
eukprot:960057-Prymnesium_polylepis.1